MSFQLSAWLQTIGLPQYAGAFESNGLTDKDVVASVSDSDLKDIGISVLGHRKKILLEAEKLKGGGAATATAPPAPAKAPAGSAGSSSAPAPKAAPAAPAVNWRPAGEIRRAEWAYSGNMAPFMKGRYTDLYQSFWAPVEYKGSPIQLISFEGAQPARLQVFNIESGGVTRKIPLDKKWTGTDAHRMRGIDVLNDHHAVVYGALDYNGNSSIIVFDPLTGTIKAGYKNSNDSAGEYERGCMLDETRVWLCHNGDTLLYNIERGFVERPINKIQPNDEITWVLPRNRTPTGPNTVMTANASAVIDIWDFREKCTVPSRSIPFGLRSIKQLNWHPSNPDTLVAAPGFNNGVHELKLVSLNTGSEMATLDFAANTCHGVGIYKDVIVAGCGDMKFFKLSEGNEIIGTLEHTTVGCSNANNVQVYADRCVFAAEGSNNDNFICFKY